VNSSVVHGSFYGRTDSDLRWILTVKVTEKLGWYLTEATNI